MPELIDRQAIIKDMRNYQKRCAICGNHFTVDWSRRRAVYCCDECRKIGAKRYARNRVKARAPQTERTCKKCGHNFMGRYRQRYCLTCLNDGSSYMTKLLNQRNPEDET